MPLRWRHNERDCVSNHQPHDCLNNRVLSKKTSKLRITGLCERNSPVTGEFPHKGPVTLKTFPYDDVLWHWVMAPVDHPQLKGSEQSQSGHGDHTNNICTDHRLLLNWQSPWIHNRKSCGINQYIFCVQHLNQTRGHQEETHCAP